MFDGWKSAAFYQTSVNNASEEVDWSNKCLLQNSFDIPHYISFLPATPTK